MTMKTNTNAAPRRYNGATRLLVLVAILLQILMAPAAAAAATRDRPLPTPRSAGESHDAHDATRQSSSTSAQIPILKPNEQARQFLRHTTQNNHNQHHQQTQQQQQQQSARRLPGGYEDYFDFDVDSLQEGMALGGGLVLLAIILCLLCCCCNMCCGGGGGCSLWDMLALFCCYEICCDDSPGFVPMVDGEMC